jgi:hypothetical protein
MVVVRGTALPLRRHPVSSITKQRAPHEPLYEINPFSRISIEVFYSDHTLETFGRRGAGWFWWHRWRGHPPEGLPTGPFPTSYAAYRHAMISTRCPAMTEGVSSQSGTPVET